MSDQSIHNEIQLSEVFKLLSMFSQCFNVDSEIIVAALIYTDQILAMNENLIITESNAKGILHSALTLAAKFFLDQFERHTMFHILLGVQHYKQHDMRRRMRQMLDRFLELI